MRSLIILLVLCCSCKSKNITISKEAETYINEVVSIMERSSINREKINWHSFRTKVLKEAEGSQTIADTYPAIHYAIKMLGDGHSYFRPVNEPFDEGEDPPVLNDENTPEDIGYIRVRYCMGNDMQKQQYVDKLINQIQTEDKGDYLKGWIIDLRGNFGGDMTPMLLGCSPILGNGIVGYTIYPTGDNVPWQLSNGTLFYDNAEQTEISMNEPYTLKRTDPYVAVLTDTLTASAGEALAIAFKGKANTKSFGWKTYGVSTSNEAYTLSDGSRMLLTVAVFADRYMNKYGGSVIPDKVVDPEKALGDAIQWLRSQQ